MCNVFAVCLLEPIQIISLVNVPFVPIPAPGHL